MKARILIVDDEDSIREMLETLFEAKGASCKTAPSAEDALRILVKESFDILLVDKNLPGMSGVELIRQLREADDEVAIMMMTGYASADSIIETLNLGIDAYVEKPFSSIQDLLDSVEAILQGRKKLRAVPSAAEQSAEKAAPASVLSTLVAVSSPEDRRVISAALHGSRSITSTPASRAVSMTVSMTSCNCAMNSIGSGLILSLCVNTNSLNRIYLTPAPSLRRKGRSCGPRGGRRWRRPASPGARAPMRACRAR